jgi:hypothetical protein
MRVISSSEGLGQVVGRSLHMFPIVSSLKSESGWITEMGRATFMFHQISIWTESNKYITLCSKNVGKQLCWVWKETHKGLRESPEDYQPRRWLITAVDVWIEWSLQVRLLRKLCMPLLVKPASSLKSTRLLRNDHHYQHSCYKGSKMYFQPVSIAIFLGTARHTAVRSVCFVACIRRNLAR